MRPKPVIVQLQRTGVTAELENSHAQFSLGTGESITRIQQIVFGIDHFAVADPALVETDSGSLSPDQGQFLAELLNTQRFFLLTDPANGPPNLGSDQIASFLVAAFRTTLIDQ